MALQVWLPLNGNLKNQGLSNITVTNYGATVNDNGKIGKCYEFNPEHSESGEKYIELNKSNDFLKSGESFSLACWFKLTGSLYSNGCGLISCVYYHSDGFSMDIIKSKKISIKLCFGNGEELEWTANMESFSNDRWYHVCFTYEKETRGLSLYVDGTLVDTKTETRDWTTHPTYQTRIGKGTQGGWQYTLPGQMNDVRIYDHCLSPKEVKEISKGLILHYKLDSLNISVNNKVCDCSGYGNDGIINGTITLSNDSPRYKSSIYILDGRVDYISGNVRMPSDACTMSIWVKGNSVGYSSYHIPFCINTANYEMSISAGGLYRQGFVINGSRSVVTTSTKVIDNKWHNLVATFDGSYIKRYVDGTMIDSVEISGTLTSGVQHLRIGNYNSGSYGNKELYSSDARIYCTALSDNDIKELYDTSAYVYNDGTLAAYEFVEEETAPEIFKNGVAKCTNVSEYSDDMKVLGDGSTFVKLLHHNNPASNLFTQDNCWNNNSDNLFSALGLLKADNLVNSAGEYEFLVCEKLTSGGTESQCRWKQTSNPATSSTLTGYQLISGAPPRSVGLMNKGSYGCFHNGGTWWCCCGSYSAYKGGIPGFFGIVTTGYLDLYIRIPDVKMLNENKAILHSNNIQSNQLIEI